jgi:Kef-type K+ transport system membrane component KefB
MKTHLTSLITPAHCCAVLLVLFCLIFFPDFSFANLEHGLEATSANSSSHGGPVVPVLFSLLIVTIAAKVGGDLAIRLRLPEVLGELIIGIIVGNLTLLGLTYFEYLGKDAAIEIISELGVIFLLFEVGLETKIEEMAKVGVSSLIAAVLGVIAPFFLGWGVAMYFAPEADILVHIFVGATLTATSVGITARVLKDIGRVQTKEAKVILGAAVIDDVLGLLVLAVVSGVIASVNTGKQIAITDLLQVFFLAIGFLILTVVLGRHFAPLIFKYAAKLKSRGVLLATSLCICFGLSYLAAVVGLAPIVGAFTAGLILEPIHYKDLLGKHRDETIERLLGPITSLFVPIFFVVMGARVDLRVFAQLDILWFALALTVAAVLGKQVCGLGVVEKGVDRLVVGLGMIPRGEVGLIFAGIGATMMLKGHPVVDSATFGAVVIMVILTTMVTPPLIKLRFNKLP